MSEPILVALIGLVGVVAGAITQSLASSLKIRMDITRIQLQLQSDNQRLWLWNRQLVDHIYKQAPPPPPPPPEGLFDPDA